MFTYLGRVPARDVVVACFLALSLGAGLQVPAACGAMDDADDASSVAQAKLQADGMSVQVSGVVTAALGGFCYVSSPDGACGLRVSTPASPDESAVVSMTGVMTTRTTGERELGASSIEVVGSANAGPITMTNRALGGGDWHYSAADGSGQRGVAGGVGLNNIGMLVRTYGTVTHSEPSLFYIDDGSLPRGGPDAAGLRVDGSDVVPPPVGAIAVVTGINSLSGPSDAPARLLIPRSQADVSYVGGTISGAVTAAQKTVVSHPFGSPHPCPDLYSNQWQITGPPGTQRIRVHFQQVSLDALDGIEIQDGFGGVVEEINYFFNAFPLVDYWSNWVYGASLTVALTTDLLYFMDQRYGLQCDSYEAYMGTMPAEGVTLTLFPGGYTAVTGADGRYVIAGIPEGSYFIQPSLAGASFIPPYVEVFVPDGEHIPGMDFVRQ